MYLTRITRFSALNKAYQKKDGKTFRKSGRPKLEDKDSLEAYGLQRIQHMVILTDQDGNETTLYFGNVTGDSYYRRMRKKKSCGEHRC